MKIIIKLKNPKYCNGCPCITSDCEIGEDCNLDYWNHDEVGYMGTRSEAKCRYCKKFISDKEQWDDCPKKPEKECQGHNNYPRMHEVNNDTTRIRRPQKCITEHGL